MNKKNDCYNCPHRVEIPGSAHSACHVLPVAQRVQLASYLITGNVPTISINDQPVLTFNRIGVENGWCNWPIDFDPVWVECRLPLNNLKMEDDGTGTKPE